MMKAYQTQIYGTEARFALTKVPVPKLSSGELLIAVKATSLNPMDNKILRQNLRGPELPAILHGDVSGVVSAVGPNVDDFKIGDEVYACAGGFIGTSGALAEFMAADVRLVARKPGSLSFVQASALPLVVITAWESLISSAELQPNEYILIHGGVGGVGHVAVQLAKSRGARVATTVSSKKAGEIARDFGADDIIYYREESVESYVRRLTDNNGFDVVYDTIGGTNFENSLQAVRTYGKVITVFIGPGATQLELMTAFSKAVSVHTQNMSIPIITGKERQRHGTILSEVGKLADAGRLKPLIDPHRFTFAEANEAHAYFESKKHIGKIVLTPCTR